MPDFLTTLTTQNMTDNALLLALVAFIVLGVLRGFGRSMVYTIIFFASSIFALWWFTPYLKTFTLDTTGQLLANIFFFWVGNTTISWAATKVVMALDSNGTGPLSRIGGALMGSIYAIGLLLTANLAYVMAVPHADRFEPLPQIMTHSKILHKSDTTAQAIYTTLQNMGIIETLISREIEEGEEDPRLTPAP